MEYRYVLNLIRIGSYYGDYKLSRWKKEVK